MQKRANMTKFHTIYGRAAMYANTLNSKDQVQDKSPHDQGEAMVLRIFKVYARSDTN